MNDVNVTIMVWSLPEYDTKELPHKLTEYFWVKLQLVCISVLCSFLFNVFLIKELNSSYLLCSFPYQFLFVKHLFIIKKKKKNNGRSSQTEEIILLNKLQMFRVDYCVDLLDRRSHQCFNQTAIVNQISCKVNLISNFFLHTLSWQFIRYILPDWT